MKEKREREGSSNVVKGRRMGGVKRATKDIGWEHCSKVDGNPNRVSCNYCGHHMYGITRLKEHLAHFGTDVVHCLLCPEELKSKMGKLLLQRGVELNEKRRKRGREEDYDYDYDYDYDNDDDNDDEDDADPPVVVVVGVEDGEKAALDKALQESLKTLEMEKKKAEEEDEELRTALLESARMYRQHHQQLGSPSGEGCSCTDHLEEIDLNVDVSAADLEESNHH